MNIHVKSRSSAQRSFLDDADDLPLLNDRAVIGNNMPPAEVMESEIAPVVADPAKPQSPAINSARDNYIHVAAFLENTPVIETPVAAATAANFMEQARKTIQDIEAERRTQVDPLNATVKGINDTYRRPRETIEGLLAELQRRMTAFARAEEHRRQDEAQKLAQAAAEAEGLARAADAAERAAVDDANCGVITDVAGAIANADKLFDGFLKADRAATRAENAIPVRLDGKLGRRVSMRAVETLLPEDPYAAILEMGISEKLSEAILTAAREYRKDTGKLPAGITAERERKF